MVFTGNYGFDWCTEAEGWRTVTWATWNDLKGNLVDTHGGRFNHLTGWASPPNIKYSRWCEAATDLDNATGNFWLDKWEIFYIGGIENLATLQALDEQDLSSGTINTLKTAFDRWKPVYPNTLVHGNIIGTESRFYNGYDTYLVTAKPDLAFMDAYEFNGNGGTLDKHYYALKTMRAFGKIGIGSTQYAEPIPYGMWYQCMSMMGRQQTQPEVCLAMYSPIAYGYKVLKGWVYSYNANIQTTYADVLFSNDNDTGRTAYFDIMAENNRQIELMGDTLVRLSNEGVWDVNDENGQIPAWSPSDIPEITDISATDDVVISKFVPLHEDFDGSSYNNETYFFLLNGNVPWADTSKTPANTAQTITLTMGGGITALEAIDLSSGAGAGTIETIPVIGGTVSITLDGGRGKLFKFQTGAPWVGFYNGE
ncbi:MAG: hypothetical protein DRP64_16700 [Verrucomicrobia bacterium]|nr:MAG: hypothetical protein DRP64_16700 [Verrucomicrobiota bacterium]